MFLIVLPEINIYQEMEITRHYCPHLTDDFLQVLPATAVDTLSINRIKGEDYFIEFYNSEGKLIISCNYPSYMHLKTFDLSPYEGNQYLLRVSDSNGVGICLYQIST